MSEKSIVLITGGNTGIGLETVKALYTSPHAYTILMGSRSIDKALTAIEQLQGELTASKSEIIPLQIDIEDDASIDNAFEEVLAKYNRIDALINNAGASYDRVAQQKPGAQGIREAWDRSYSVNVTSTQVFTHTFMPLLLASSDPRLLFVTSGLSSLTTCAAGPTNKINRGDVPKGWPKPAAPAVVAYRSSKTALNMMMLDWARLLKADGVKVFAISPGFLATGLGGMGSDFLKKAGAGDPSIGGIFIKDVVEGKRDQESGKVIDKDGVQPW